MMFTHVATPKHGGGTCSFLLALVVTLSYQFTGDDMKPTIEGLLILALSVAGIILAMVV